MPARPRLSRARILQAALRLVDRGGLEALSMRRLGAALRVDPMAVYHHLPGKDAVLAALIGSLFDSMPSPPASGSWQRRVRAWAGAYRDIARAHPALVLEIVSRPEQVAIAAAHANAGLESALRDAGLAGRRIEAATAAIVDYVNGAVLAGAAAEHADPRLFADGLDVIVAGIEAIASRTAQ